MRARTRNFLIGVGIVVGLLLALGAVPGLLKSGDPYYVTASPVGSWDGPNTTVGDNATAVNASTFGDLRYPYTTDALGNVTGNETGRSGAYWRGPVGFKETFTHSPFDEMNALTQNNPRATTADGGVYVHDNRTVYLLAVTQDGQ
jgi:hypothetical protein